MLKVQTAVYLIDVTFNSLRDILGLAKAILVFYDMYYWYLTDCSITQSIAQPHSLVSSIMDGARTLP